MTIRATVRTVKGIAGGDELLSLVPDARDDRKDELDPRSAAVAGAALLTEPATLSGYGLTRWSGDFDFILSNRTDRAEYLRRQKLRHGVVAPFWMPSWRDDLNPLTDVVPAGRDVLFVRPNGFEWVYEAERYGVALVLPGGVIDAFSVIGYDPSNGALRLGGTLDYAVSLRSLSMISLVRRVRASADAEWSFVNSNVVRTSLSVVEVVGEGAFA